MNVLSLFDGMGCGRIALDKIGVTVTKYYAAEIDPAAIKVTKDNYPDTEHLGDINNWPEWGIDWASIDLIIGGSPCQGFSLIGKQLAFEDGRSKLFFRYWEILSYVKWVNPKVKFLLENVRMAKNSTTVISNALGVYPHLIDAKDFSACARPRLYWFNWHFKKPASTPKKFGDVIDYSSYENEMSEGWVKWWAKNAEYRLKKSFSKVVYPESQGVCMIARQYANWDGNFIPTPSGTLRKPTKNELARLVGAPNGYFKSVSQRAAEQLTGNGWSVDVVSEIFKQGLKP